MAEATVYRSEEVKAQDLRAAQRTIDVLEHAIKVVRDASHGSYKARTELASYVDGYWHQLVLGDREDLAFLTCREDQD